MVRELNDKLRIFGDQSIGKICMTQSIHALGPNVVKLINIIRQFDNFSNDKDDPWNEHDFGKVSYENRDVFWKIDYFNHDYTMGVDDNDKNNTTLCKRVMTIMYADEY